MAATRPRESILNLFDPLISSPEDRDAPSPDSDKENANPPIASDCSMTTAFFGRTYKQPSPILLRRRLVDVGDITADDPSMLAMLTDEELDHDDSDEENDTLILRHAIAATPVRSAFLPERTTPSASTPRTPLGELSLDPDITPMPRNKMYRRPVPLPSSLPTTDTDLPAANDNTNIGTVINSVNASGATFASPRLNTRPLDLHDLAPEDDHAHDKPHDIQAPQITISSADDLSDSLAALNLNTPTGTLLTDTSRPFSVTPRSPPSEASSSPALSRLRPNPPNTSSHDKNRHSVDLYSSFQLQLQSEEASFDLLNDKISFLVSSNGMDSFLNSMEGDESFDMAVEEANLQSALDKIRLEEQGSSETVLPVKEIVPAKEIVPRKDVAPVFSATGTKSTVSAPQNSSPDAASSPKMHVPSLLKKRSSLGTSSGLNSPISGTFAFGHKGSASPPNKLPTSSNPTITSVFAPPPPPPSATEPVALTYADVRTPAPPLRDGPGMPPPAVPALRIVKRAKKFGHEKSSSSGSASSSEASTVPDPVREPSMETYAAPRIQRTISVAPAAVPPTVPALVRHVSAPVVTATAPPIRGVGPSRMLAPVQSTSLPPLIRTGTGPRRVLITENPMGAVSQKVPPVVDMTGPRRVLIAAPTAPKLGVAASMPAPTPVPVGAPSKVPAMSGLRAPTRYAGTGAGASALPRPVSRLPAPSASGIARPRVVTGGSGSGLGNGSQGTAAGRTVPPRRMAYGGH